jgi:outer membrane protein TolC
MKPVDTQSLQSFAFSVPSIFGQPRLGVAAMTGFALFIGAHSAHAMQPLSNFLESAKTQNFDAREADAVIAQRDAEAQTSSRKLWPTLSARGVYTRNQYEAIARVPNGGEAVISPQDQLDAFLSADLTIIDFASWARVSAGNALHDAAKARKQGTTLDVELEVTRAYYAALAARAVEEAASKSLDVAERNQKILQDRKGAGLATDLDLQRSVGETARAKQRLANASYLTIVSERALATASGLTPEKGGAVPPDDLHEEAALASFTRGQKGETPSLAASRLETEAQDKTASAQWRSLWPSLSANATERITNATGFAGRNASYAITATLAWKLDASTFAAAKGQDAAHDVAMVRQARLEKQQEDRVANAWDLVKSSVSASKAARAEAESSRLALALATDRYQAGTALQFEVLDATRQAFQSEVTRIQSDADLAIARQSLRILSTGVKP